MTFQSIPATVSTLLHLSADDNNNNEQPSNTANSSINRVIIPQSSITTIAADSYDAITTSIITTTVPQKELLTQLLRVLKPGGYCALLIPQSESAQIQSQLVLSGFTDVSEYRLIAAPASNQQAEITARRPPWTSGASKPLTFLNKNKNKSTTVSTASISTVSISSNKWTIGNSDLAESDLLIDEDSLLDNEIDKPIIPIGNSANKSNSEFDCGTGTGPSRKACKNCSCGLADVLATTGSTAPAAATAAAAAAAPVSACGSCNLGDAFRCSTCPYLGQPAFSKTSGDRVKLAL